MGLNMVKASKNYGMFQLLSPLQKDIRKGKEYNALFWAIQLEKLNATAPIALWNRLGIIASEDIGLAHPYLPLLIETLRNSYFEAVRRKSDSYRLFLGHAIVLLARSKKSRLVHDLTFQLYSEVLNRNKRLKIPDYAKDMHTPGGKKRGMAHFQKKGLKLVNETTAFPTCTRAELRSMK